jgi:hypothetical protein
MAKVGGQTHLMASGSIARTPTANATGTEERAMLLPTAHDEAHERLHRAGQSLGTYWLAGPHAVVRVVEGVHGENVIRGEGRTLATAYLSACDQVRPVGMFGLRQGRERDRRR